MFDEFGGLPQMGGFNPMMGQGMFAQDPKKKKKGIGFNPLMMLSPLGGLMAESPKMGLMALSPGLGIANLLGAFK